ncbi:MAG: HlyC/CorC family transporter [Phycisphaeraceae bacterium]|nr:HlyC/CorC family transporter [Phycisphaeraceae bacterium]
MNEFALILLAAMPVLLGLSAVCSASETALFSVTQAELLRLRKSHPGVYSAVASMLTQPRSLLVAILLANTLVNAAYFVVMAAVQSQFSGLWSLGYLAVSILALVVLAEVIPKSLATSQRVLLCRLVARPVLWWFVVITPVRRFAERFIIAPFARLMAPVKREARGTLSAEELALLLDVGAKEGVIAHGEQRLLADVVSLSTIRVREVMTPRMEVVFVPASSRVDELLALAGDTGFTRYPVCRQGGLETDSVVGFIDLQEVLPLLNVDPATAESPVLRHTVKPEYLPERVRLDQALEHFRVGTSDIALCVDEHGAITGMVSLEQVLAEIVNVAPEAAGAEIDRQIRIVGVGAWEVPGRLSVRDWVEFFGLGANLADGRVSTVGGLIVSGLGRLPREGDEVVVGNIRLRVERTDGRVVERARVWLIDPAATERGEDSQRRGS